jgi:hypothetical protein
MEIKDEQHLIYMPVEKPIECIREFNKNLNVSLCVPSVSNSYSMCLEYVRGWTKAKFQPDYFKSEYIDGKNILDDFRSKDKNELVKVLKPALSIIPQIDMDFDREHLDLYNYGTNLYYNKCSYRDAFFKDMGKKNFISVAMEILQISFTFRIKVSSEAHALDLAKFIQMAFRTNGTQGNYVDMDFHIPTELMLRVATDSGFEVKDNEVADMPGFLYYLNRHSQLPFMYKLRTIKGKYEYFIKMSEMYIHTRTNNCSVDKGEREGQLMNNFVVEFECTVRFPVPKFYAYYSLEKHEIIRAQKMDGSYTVYELCMTHIPQVNSKGWNQYMTTEFLQDDEDYKEKKPVEISLEDLLSGTGKGRLKEISDYTKSLYLSPAVFIEIKLFNDTKEIEIDIDWKEYTLKSKTPLVNMKSFIVVYADLRYINEQQIAINKYKDSRIK